MKKLTLTYLLLAVWSLGVHAHDKLVFTKNQGQWHENVKYRAKLAEGNFYLEKDGYTALFYERSKFSREGHVDKDYEYPRSIKAHAIKMRYVNSNPYPIINNKGKSEWYENYYLGNDKSKWASNVHAYDEVNYKDIYDYIDLKYYQYAKYVKYDYRVSVGGNPNDIQFVYSGQDDMYIRNGSLYLINSLGKLIEKEPIAYQIINGEEVEVLCKYTINGDTVGFEFPNGYDLNYPLTIDPVLVFSSYTASTSDNWGFTATYDNQEFTYAGGIVFGMGYPTTAGAFQTAFSGASPTVDIGISKFLPDGTGLVYSTYLGGTGSESPHSLVVDDNDNLFVLSTTSSNDFPVSATAYDGTFNGGIGFVPNYYNYALGSDLAITKFNPAGTALIGSTYLGGSDNDGLNDGNAIFYFYGDEFRGDIIIDAAGNCIVSSCTKSADFPVAGSAPQPLSGGGFDGIISKFNPNLSNLLWSTYWGGSSDDACFGLNLDSNGDVYVTGATNSADFFTSFNALNPNPLGGVDGFISKFSANGVSILGSTFLGTASRDLSYFVQIDDNDDVYSYGVTEGAYPVSSGLYSVPNSNQFVHKLNNNLTANVWSTVIGTGNGTVDISPTAFLVNNCGLIYIAGWGGDVNASSVASSTTLGLPITPNGYQTTTSGSDFYFAVLETNAQSLLYGTFLGGTSPDHVDGGTSRFDKKGIIYHAVCAGCGGNSNFPTTPGAWSQTNNASNCNLAVFKFGINNIQTLVSVPDPYICIPNSYQFFNNSTGANTYEWSFGDGDSSNLFEPSHLYQDTGQYTVTLVASDSLGCIEPDTAEIVIDVYQLNDATIDAIPTICPGDSIDLQAYGGATYTWFPLYNISGENTSHPTVWPDSTFTYFVEVHDSCSTDTISITVNVFQNTVSTSPDTLVCIGNNIDISAFGGVSYEWDADPTLSSFNTQTTNATPGVPTWYYVTVTTVDGCELRDSVFVDVELTPSNPTLPNDTTICLGDTLEAIASGATNISWVSTYNINSSGALAEMWPTTDFYYVAEFGNVCDVVLDSFLVSVDIIEPTISNDTTICPGGTATLIAGGGVDYQWSPPVNLSSTTDSITFASPLTETTYTATVTNANGCARDIDVTVSLYNTPYVNAGPDAYIEYGESVVLNGSAGGHLYWWSPPDSLSCDDCLQPVANPSTLTNYVLYTVDQNGCTNSDTVTVYIDAVLYVPNAFTPNGDGMNDIFYAYGKEINTFVMYVFNRWGELIYTTEDLNTGWDGTYKGIVSPSDVYVWKIIYTDYIHPEVYNEMIGHVTLVR